LFISLQSAFPAVAQGLQQLLDFPDNNIEDVFCLNFAVATEHFGCVTTHPLIENGENIAVTRENRQQLREIVIRLLFSYFFFHRYVDLYTRFLLLDSVAASLKVRFVLLFLFCVCFNRTEQRPLSAGFLFWRSATAFCSICCRKSWNVLCADIRTGTSPSCNE
jgi:hypothetical protein